MSNLVIVESPAKAHTIKSYLGSSYKVLASKGHIRDLPKSTFGIDVEDNFKPRYINIRGKGDLIKELKKEAKKADSVFLATDLDREGEAISWHLAAALDIPENKVKRITFNEITKKAIKEAVKKPRSIDIGLVNAQQTRRILDRIVGYKASPLLWEKIKSGLSAGRVQSVAAKIIVEREEAIRAFVPKEYWTVEAVLNTEDKKKLTVKYYGLENGEKAELSSESDAMRIVSSCSGQMFTVKDIKNGVRYKSPAAPFTTSTLQQEASKKLNFQSQRTMKIAQELYEGVDIGSENGGTQGLITYMRTDSLRISDDARHEAREFIRERFGDKYCPEKERIYKSKGNSQDAHEAIRPSNVKVEPQEIKKYLSTDQYKLYRLIYNRFVASQMESAELSTVNAEFICGGYSFRASGYTVKFSGYMAVYEESIDTPDEEKGVKIPEIKKGEKLESEDVIPEQHFTEPPPRYTEASLVKFLEEMGIGRPSTYTPIITIIISRGYVERDGKSLKPTVLGEITTKLMEDAFPDIVNYKFTAMMEDRLDGIEEGNASMTEVLSDFYENFSSELEKAKTTLDKATYTLPVEETDMICENCGSRMIIKSGRYGKFVACPNYPECKNTKPLEKSDDTDKTEAVDMKCEICGSDMVKRRSRYGSFFACSKYPECKFIKQDLKSIGVSCPKCGKDIVMKHGKRKAVFYSCQGYPECDFSSWDMPVNEKCPKCGGLLYSKKGKNNILFCKNDKCGYKAETNDQADI